MCLSRLKLSAAFGLELVTTFQAARPPLIWSIEAKMRATLYGSLKLVETVAPRPICVVAALSTEISVVGSKRHRNEGWSPGSITSPSETNSRSNLPRSAMRRDLLDHRQLVVAGRGAVVTPAGRMVAGAENENAEMHLPLPGAHPGLPIALSGRLARRGRAGALPRRNLGPPSIGRRRPMAGPRRPARWPAGRCRRGATPAGSAPGSPSTDRG